MRATAEEKKGLLLSEFIDSRRTLLTVSGKIPREEQETVFLGTWSIQDLLAHLIGWDHSNLAAIPAIFDNQLPVFYNLIDKDWRSYNARLVSLYKKGTMLDLLQAAQVSQGKLIDRLTGIPAKDLFRDHGVRYRGYKVTIARLIEAETKDERVHSEQVRGFIVKILATEGHPALKQEAK